MRFSHFTVSAGLVAGVMSSPLDIRASKPPYFLLTGDSTVAINGGWGDGFNDFLKDPAKGENHGKSGATTVSFRAQGLWDAVISATNEHAAEYEPIVTIQFGHNDQKAAANISVEQFQANLETMAKEVQAAGGTPILITSLTRRTFSGGAVIQNLEEQRVRAIAAAEAVGAKYLDLNEASTTYVNAIGQGNADSYNLSDGDRTHLNTLGERLFGRMVVDLLLRKRKGLKRFFEPAGLLSKKIWAGEFATGDE
ncbi:acetylesterase [Thelonectria olida]|uniref:Acetylesterase n=1 Tax=Thelonectria olida TaxID=1576542 RepID=A0A9P8VYY3_9HYPO|nr:acetylesterase [Thelonectria olida]